MVKHDDKWFSTNWYGLALQKLVYTATAKLQKWNGHVKLEMEQSVWGLTSQPSSS